MKRISIALSLSVALLLGGCATQEGPEYSGATYEQIKTYENGTVESVRPVVISDNGMGTFVGALVGTVLGSMVGEGRGSALATLAGGLSGAYVGSQANKSNASELAVRLDDGRHIVVVVKGKHFYVGERVQIIKEGNRVDQVYKLN